MKGQLTIQYLASFIFFIGLIVYIYFAYSANLPAFVEEVRKEDVRSKAFQLSEILINDPGNPVDWMEPLEIPIDVVLVVDVSGSMLFLDDNGDVKIDRAKEAAKTFVDQLNSTKDRCGIVIFNQTDYLYQELTFDNKTIKDRIDTINVNRNADTQIEGGIRNATEHLKNKGRVNVNKVQILLTDGKDDPCCSNAEGATQEANETNITIYTIGLGSPTYFNQSLLIDIANVTGGKYYFAPTGSQLVNIYKEIAFELKFHIDRIGLSDENLNKTNLITMYKVRYLEDLCTSFKNVQQKLAMGEPFSIHVFNISQDSGERNRVMECVPSDFPKTTINATIKRIVVLDNTETGKLELAEIIIQM